MADNEKKNEEGNGGEHRQDEDERQDEKHRPPEHRVKPPRPFGS